MDVGRQPPLRLWLVNITLVQCDRKRWHRLAAQLEPAWNGVGLPPWCTTMTRPEIAHPPIVEADEVGLTSAEAVRLARASLDRLERAAALRDHLEMLFAMLARRQAICTATAG